MKSDCKCPSKRKVSKKHRASKKVSKSFKLRSHKKLHKKRSHKKSMKKSMKKSHKRSHKKLHKKSHKKSHKRSHKKSKKSSCKSVCVAPKKSHKKSHKKASKKSRVASAKVSVESTLSKLYKKFKGNKKYGMVLLAMLALLVAAYKARDPAVRARKLAEFKDYMGKAKAMGVRGLSKLAPLYEKIKNKAGELKGQGKKVVVMSKEAFAKLYSKASDKGKELLKKFSKETPAGDVALDAGAVQGAVGPFGNVRTKVNVIHDKLKKLQNTR